MRPGPDQIIACPHCHGLARHETWLSGTAFGAVLWSDGKQEIQGLMPEPLPAAVRCRHCADFYWLAEAEKIGTVDLWGSNGRQASPARCRSAGRGVNEEEYYDAIERNLPKDRQQERRLRILAWRRRNDPLRFHPIGNVTASGRCRQNLEALARLLDESDETDLIMKAEVLRELGECDLAKEVLRRVSSSEHCGVTRQLHDLCSRGDSCVRQLSFEGPKMLELLSRCCRPKTTSRGCRPYGP